MLCFHNDQGVGRRAGGPHDSPVEVAVIDAGRAARLVFADGSMSAVRAETLRLGCRCAGCVRRRIDGRFPGAFPHAAVAAVNPVGGYAAQFVFADGHDRGIFPWSYVRELADAPVSAEAA